MALYFYFNESTGDLVYSDKATYGVEGYVSLGEQTNVNPGSSSYWVFDSQRSAIVTVSKDESIVGKIAGLKSMSSMFNSCSNLTSLDLSGFDTSAVLSMTNMLADCNSLTSLDLSDFDTSTVTFMNYMFSGCTSLTSLDLSGFDTSAVKSMSYMFDGCYDLVSLDLSGFDASAVVNAGNMFRNCNRLRLITISDKMSNVLSQLPADQYYPAAGGSPVAKADLTAGTWVRDEADLTKVTSLVQQAQMQQAISRRIGSLRRDLEARIREASALLDQLDFAAGGLIPVENGGTGATSVADAVAALGLTSVKSNAPYVRSIKPTTLKVKTGSTVVAFGNSNATLFTASQMTSLLGRAFNQATDAVLVMSGDGDAQAGQLLSAATYVNGTTNVYARYRGSSDVNAQGPGRIHWVVVYS